MKILVISRNAWDDTNAIGNTLSNFLTGIKDVEFAGIYFRSSSPRNNLCKKYYRTTETEVLKNWFTPHKNGKSFVLDASIANSVEDSAARKEKKIVKFIRNRELKIAYKLSDYIWYRKKWINENLKKFVEDFNPDLIVTFVKSAPQYYLTIKYLRDNFKIPLFTWIADDEYTMLKKNGAKREIENLRYILRESAFVAGCSQEVCDYYNEIFGCQATPLYKGCDLSVHTKKETSDRITLVYAGNLLYGRLEIINLISNVVEKLAKDGKKLSFEVYSNTELSANEQRMYFGDKQFTKYMGRRDYAFIKKRLSESNLVLHVESFDDDQVLKTKYSFSTKIIDYLQSGSVLLAVGPSNVASMKYISKIPGAYVITDTSSLEEKIKDVLDSSSSFSEREADMREFAKCNHDCVLVSEKIQKIFDTISGEGV